MKKTILSLLIILPQLLQAQTITFLDKKNNQPIPAVVVRGSNNNFLSNDEGILKLNLSSPQDMVASHISYESKSFRVNPGDNIQVFLDRMEFSLSEVVVSSFETERPLLQQAAAIHKVPYSDLLRFNETSLVNAFNTRPGIKVEERAPASYRISIRGSSLRAPFGVRNVKVYWNEIPFTAPDGTTPLNILDLSNLGNTEIIK
ncbi:MAG TPA: TonB-dependent receptor plug domain-containing protein, partial [Cyclobacteriaceae bacterium]|nr:TonB-dependent receptor plug domain-containing protein [Cyclobacteriaceae bacterium]